MKKVSKKIITLNDLATQIDDLAVATSKGFDHVEEQMKEIAASFF